MTVRPSVQYRAVPSILHIVGNAQAKAKAKACSKPAPGYACDNQRLTRWTHKAPPHSTDSSDASSKMSTPTPPPSPTPNPSPWPPSRSQPEVLNPTQLELVLHHPHLHLAESAGRPWRCSRSRYRWCGRWSRWRRGCPRAVRRRRRVR